MDWVTFTKVVAAAVVDRRGIGRRSGFDHRWPRSEVEIAAFLTAPAVWSEAAEELAGAANLVSSFKSVQRSQSRASHHSNTPTCGIDFPRPISILKGSVHDPMRSTTTQIEISMIAARGIPRGWG